MTKPQNRAKAKAKARTAKKKKTITKRQRQRGGLDIQKWIYKLDIEFHDLLKALFDVKREKCIIGLGDAWATTLANGDKSQFKVIADDEGETFTVTAEDVSSSISDSNFRKYVEFLLKYDLCQLMAWRMPESVSYYSGSVKRTVSVQAPGPNLIMKRKLGRTWTVLRLLTNLMWGKDTI